MEEERKKEKTRHDFVFFVLVFVAVVLVCSTALDFYNSFLKSISIGFVCRTSVVHGVLFQLQGNKLSSRLVWKLVFRIDFSLCS